MDKKSCRTFLQRRINFRSQKPDAETTKFPTFYPRWFLLYKMKCFVLISLGRCGIFIQV